MATRKDQLDAFNFARRRMVANLVAPTATGSDEGAPRPVKTFATSIVLSAIAVAAVAVLGVFKPAAPSGWQGGLAVDSGSGATYVDQQNQLHAIYNITSARLLLGGKFQKFDVPDSTINDSGIPVGSPVGILGAPEDVPGASNMNLLQWSLCQNEVSTANEGLAGGKTYLEIGYGPTSAPELWTAASNHGVIVHDSAGYVYLIDGDYKYPVGNDNGAGAKTVGSLLTAANQDNDILANELTGYWVSDAWLGAFSTGSALAFPTLPGLGTTPSASHQLGEVGQYGSLGQADYVQTDQGIVRLSTFAFDLYMASPALSANQIKQFAPGVLTPSSVNVAQSSAGGELSPAKVFDTGSYGDEWPQNPPIMNTDISNPADANVCVGYDGASDGGAAALTTWLSPNLPYGTPGGQFGLSQSASTTYANVVMVKPGYGLIAQSSSGGSTGTGNDYLIEDSGYRYALLSGTVTSNGSTQTISAINQLGYANVKVEPVPSGLLGLVDSGTMLDPTKAGVTPGIG